MLARLLLFCPIAMLTTKEVLEELRRVGVRDRISLRAYLKDFEDYMMTHHGVRILTTKRKPGTSTEKRAAVKTKTGAAVLR